MKIEVNQDLIITSKDQVKVGMHLWTVGQGGVTGVSKPHYKGQVIGFGSADYTFSEGVDTADGFVIKDPYSPEVEFVVCAKSLQNNHRTHFYNIPEGGYQRHVPYSLEGLTVETAYVVTESYLPAPYNNWYTCDSLEKAQQVYEEMLSKWTGDHDKVRKEYEKRMDEYDRDDAYYDDY